MATIWELKSKYPKADLNEIVNYMVTAYCPIIAQNASLSDDEKKDRLMRYSQQIEGLAVQQRPLGAGPRTERVSET